MTITHTMLRCFNAVAESGNLADAGARLGRTPSAISMTLKQMEDHLGARLFETDRKNRLTPLGEEIFGLAQQQVRQYDETIETIEDLARAPKGLIRVAAIPSAMHVGLPSALSIMTARRPSLQIEIQDADSNIVKRSLIRGEVDIGIVSGRSDLNGLRRVALFEDKFGIVAAPDHPLIRRSTAPRLQDIEASGFVRNALCAEIQMPAFQALLQSARVTARNTLSLISLVRTGSWVTVLPAAVVGMLPEHLAFREITELDQRREVSLMIREQSQFPELVREFAEVLNQQRWTHIPGRI